MRHKDEYIAELEARLEREVTEVAQVLSQSVTHSVTKCYTCTIVHVEHRLDFFL